MGYDNLSFSTVKYTKNIVEPGYNDIGLCDTSSIASDILWYHVIKTLVYKEAKYSVPYMALITQFGYMQAHTRACVCKGKVVLV